MIGLYFEALSPNCQMGEIVRFLYICLLANPSVKKWVTLGCIYCGLVRVEPSSKDGSRIQLYEDSRDPRSTPYQMNKFEVQTKVHLIPHN